MEDEWKIMDGCGRFCTMSRWAPEITREGSAGEKICQSKDDPCSKYEIIEDSSNLPNRKAALC